MIKSTVSELIKEDVELKTGTYLLVRGPAYIKLKCGKADIFGAVMERGHSLTVVSGRQVPVRPVEDSLLELRVGSRDSIQFINEDPVPRSWDEAVNMLMSTKRFISVVLGDVDVGKSSFILYLANRLVSERYKIGIIDCDIGQSDIGPPGTIGLSILDNPIYSYSDAELFNAYFIGDKTPTGHLLPIVLGSRKMLEEAFDAGVDGVLVNTTGFIYGGVARALKLYKIEVLKPTHIFGLQYRHELEPLIRFLGIRDIVCFVDVSKYISRKGLGARKIFRRLKMGEYFRDIKILTFDLNKVRVENTILPAMIKVKYIDDLVYNLISKKVDGVYLDRDSIYILFKDALDKSRLIKLISKFKEEFKEVKIISLNKVRGLYLGLYNDSKFAGVGVLENIDIRKRKITIKASINPGMKVNRILFGYLILDDNYNEVSRLSPGYI